MLLYCKYGEIPKVTDSTNLNTDSTNLNTGSNGGGGDPQPPKNNLVVVENPHSEDIADKKGKGIPQSTSNNSITSAVSYTSEDINLAAELDKKNF